MVGISVAGGCRWFLVVVDISGTGYDCSNHAWY